MSLELEENISSEDEEMSDDEESSTTDTESDTSSSSDNESTSIDHEEQCQTLTKEEFSNSTETKQIEKKYGEKQEEMDVSGDFATFTPFTSPAPQNQDYPMLNPDHLKWFSSMEEKLKVFVRQNSPLGVVTIELKVLPEELGGTIKNRALLEPFYQIKISHLASGK